MIYKIILNYWNASLKFIWKEIIWMIVIKCLLTSYLIFQREDIIFPWHRWDVTCSPGTFRMSWLPWNVDLLCYKYVHEFVCTIVCTVLYMHNCLYVQFFFPLEKFTQHRFCQIILSKGFMILKRFRTTAHLINYYISLKAASL